MLFSYPDPLVVDADRFMQLDNDLRNPPELGSPIIFLRNDCGDVVLLTLLPFRLPPYVISSSSPGSCLYNSENQVDYWLSRPLYLLADSNGYQIGNRIRPLLDNS